MENFKIRNLLINIHPQKGASITNHNLPFNDVAEGMTKCIQPSKSILRTSDEKQMHPLGKPLLQKTAADTPDLADIKDAIAVLQQTSNHTATAPSFA